MRALSTLAAGLAIAGAVVALASSDGTAPAPARTVVPTAHEAAAPAAPSPFVGLQADDAFDRTAAYRRTALRRIAATRAGVVRRTFDWSLVEPRRGKPDWKAYDAQVAAAARAGLRILPVLFNAPPWASSQPKKGAKRGTYPPRRVSQFAAFAAAAAKRYGPSGSYWRRHPTVPRRPITSWQVWNEPNLPVYWQPQPRARAYVALLAATSTALKRVDPSAMVLTGGLPKSKQGIPLTTFLSEMYAGGGAAAFDALAVNPYSPTAAGVVAFLREMRATMDANGDVDGLLWATEIGWSDTGPGALYKLGRTGQAAAIAEVLPALWAERAALKLQGVVYFAWRDGPPYAGGKDFWGLHTGLLDIDGKAKPAYAAFTSAVAGLR